MAESMAKVEDHGEDPDALKDLEQHWERFMVRVPWWMGNQWLSWPSWAAKNTSYAVDSRNFIQTIPALQCFQIQVSDISSWPETCLYIVCV